MPRPTPSQTEALTARHVPIMTPPKPGPGERCPHCETMMAPTPLELWMARQDPPESFTSLAKRMETNKNLLWRLNHQAPSWTPKPRSSSERVQADLLELTGLTVEQLQNTRPSHGDYANGDRQHRALAAAEAARNAH